MKILIVALLLTAVPGLFSGPAAWYVSHGSMVLLLAGSAAIIYHTTRHPTALLWLAICVWDVVLYPVWIISPMTHSSINWLVWPFAVLLTIWHMTRTATPRNTSLAFRRPHTAQGWLLAAAGFPGGSCAVISDGRLYRYRAGYLTRSTTFSPSNYVIIPVSDKIPRQLEALVGNKWTWRSNCLTLIVRIILWTR